jgi:hypothetical protein
MNEYSLAKVQLYYIEIITSVIIIQHSMSPQDDHQTHNR